MTSMNEQESVDHFTSDYTSEVSNDNLTPESLHEESSDDEGDDHKRRTCRECILEIMNTRTYRVVYCIIYVNMLVLDALRLSLVQKENDNVFFGIVVFLAILFGLDIFFSCVAKRREYFLGFYFWTDLTSIMTVALTASATNISLYIFYSFLKTVMIIRVTRIIQALKMHRRKKLVEKFLRVEQEKEIEEDTMMEGEGGEGEETEKAIGRRKSFMYPPDGADQK